jgi:hypothetical protein
MKLYISPGTKKNEGKDWARELQSGVQNISIKLSLKDEQRAKWKRRKSFLVLFNACNQPRELCERVKNREAESVEKSVGALPGAAGALWGEKIITVLPMVVVKSRNPYTVCVTRSPPEDEEDAGGALEDWATSGLT